MIVANGDVDKTRHLPNKRPPFFLALLFTFSFSLFPFPFLLQKPTGEILLEPVSAILIGDVHIEDGVFPAGIVKNRFWHGDIDDFARSRPMFIFVFGHARKLKALAIIAERDVMPG